MEDASGVEAVVEREQALWNAFPGLEHTLEDVVAEGDKVAYRFTSTGTHEGAFRGIQPTGREFDAAGTEIVRIADGALAEIRLTDDALGHVR